MSIYYYKLIMKQTLNFDNAIIYAIVDKTNNNTCYGSTTNSLNYRISQHKGNYKKSISKW